MSPEDASQSLLNDISFGPSVNCVILCHPQVSCSLHSAKLAATFLFRCISSVLRGALHLLI